MFTGIITGIGRIVVVHSLGESSSHGKQLEIEVPPGYLDDVALGDSVALNGACMTATRIDKSSSRFTVDISAESLDKTTGLDSPGPVNLEKALRASDRLGGHVVSGHVDGVGHITHFGPVGESWDLRIRAPGALSPFLAIKGSVTVNGVSLTVNTVHDGDDGTEIGINLIPQTMQHTTLGGLAPGAGVNLEIDLFARYLHRMIQLTSRPQPATFAG
ncbi:riboflavin synthase [Variovorax sp. VNK109]|jgi:riboflavin synthase|uniref:riboflavin synthase n=1 Tax=Variovorax sp. VNK109 TaxID=3400919 RepID=UPI003C0C524C